MSLPPDSEDIQGWLKKKGDKGIVKGWKNRWFQEKERKIYYYRSRDDNEPLGFIDIDKISSISKTADGAFGFAVGVPGRVYVLQAFTDGDRQEWLRLLKAKTGLSLDEAKV
jgi:hypothetical protein